MNPSTAAITPSRNPLSGCDQKGVRRNSRANSRLHTCRTIIRLVSPAVPHFSFIFSAEYTPSVRRVSAGLETNCLDCTLKIGSPMLMFSNNCKTEMLEKFGVFEVILTLLLIGYVYLPAKEQYHTTAVLDISKGRKENKANEIINKHKTSEQLLKSVWLNQVNKTESELAPAYRSKLIVQNHRVHT